METIYQKNVYHNEADWVKKKTRAKRILIRKVDPENDGHDYTLIFLHNAIVG
ncbi:hypothetical protein [Bacillus sp. FJAT-50079]|uniref:hypothetical protein n=1 Tax=Bacillus sp. FJAT-50079 TaxID=2833577 RepID=UPI001BC9975E|nr:hypothetical protein [Bacillus sp. FJAT-50079]MBS4209546.1 hypothetical protein [Bacillus sp. FJAT-50079]